MNFISFFRTFAVNIFDHLDLHPREQSLSCFYANLSFYDYKFQFLYTDYTGKLCLLIIVITKIYFNETFYYQASLSSPELPVDVLWNCASTFKKTEQPEPKPNWNGIMENITAGCRHPGKSSSCYH